MKGRLTREYRVNESDYKMYEDTFRSFSSREGTYESNESDCMDGALVKNTHVKCTRFKSKDGKESAEWVDICRVETEPMFERCSMRNIGGTYYEALLKQIGYCELHTHEYFVKDNLGKVEYKSGSYVLRKEFVFE